MYLPTHLTLEPGDSGEFVAEMQRRLVGQKLLDQGNISGNYDGITTSAVKAFQALNGLEADGIAGPETLRLLNAAAGFFSNTDGEETSASSDSGEEDKVAENGDRYDDFLVSQRLHEHKENLEEQASIEYLRQQDYNTINELRAKDIEQKGRDQQLWSKDNPQMAADKMQAIQETVRTQQVDAINQERAQAAPVRDEQLQVTREGVQAKTLGDTLKEDPSQARERAEAAQRGEGAQREGAQRDGPQRDDLQARQQVQQQQQQGQQLGPDGRPLAGPMQPGQGQGPHDRPIRMDQQPGRQQTNALGQTVQLNALGQPAQQQSLNPDLQRTERRLDHGSRRDATATGHHLDDRGVQNLGHVPNQQLGQLHPSSTPNVGIGGPSRGAGM